MLVSWYPKKHAIGLKKIDAQHKELHDLVLELYRDFIANEHKDKLPDFFEKLLSLSNTHFNYEESLFDVYNYPKAYSHKQEHALFIQKVLEYKDNFEQGNSNITFSLLNFVHKWLDSHTHDSDRAYVGFFKKVGLN